MLGIICSILSATAAGCNFFYKFIVQSSIPKQQALKAGLTVFPTAIDTSIKAIKTANAQVYRFMINRKPSSVHQTYY